MSSRPPLLSDVFPEYDPRSQIVEIRLLLQVVFTWRNELNGRLAEAEHDLQQAKQGSSDAMEAHSCRDSLGYQSCFRDAACSQAAVGALAPFIEGLLVHMFAYLAVLTKGRVRHNEHHRWKLAVEEFWNPHTVSEQGKRTEKDDVVRGTMQILEALDVVGYFPESVKGILRALFGYRNRALHHGYEWPQEVRERFRDQIETSKEWDEWFGWTLSDGRPWMASMKDRFITQCITTAEQLISAFGNVAQAWGGDIR